MVIVIKNESPQMAWKTMNAKPISQYIEIIIYRYVIFAKFAKM